MSLRDWRATCINTGVRIPSTAMTSNTALPLPQSSAHTSKFQSVFEGASQQSASPHASVDPHAKPQAGKDAKSSKASDQGDAQSASGPGTDSSASGAGAADGERWHAICAEPYVSTASPAISPSVVQPPPSLVQANPYGTTLPIALAITTLEGVTETRVISPGASSSAVTSASSRVLDKLEKPKTTSAHDNAGLLASVAVAVVEQNNVPLHPVLSGPGTGREQGDGSSGTSAKTVAANDPKGTHPTLAEHLVGAPVGDGNAKIIPQGPQLFDATVAAQGPGESLFVATGMPVASVPPGNIEASLPVSKATQKAAFDVISSGNSASPTLFDVGKSAASGSVDAALRSAQGGGQVSQSSQADPAKLVTITAKMPDNGALQSQAQTVAMHVASHDTAAAQHATTGIADTARAAKSPEAPASTHMAGDEPVASSGINAAKLIQSMGASEMRVGMHSTEFGDISIRTTISQQQMVTQISLSHNDLSQAISAHVATVQAKLGEDYGLHASIEINNHGSALSGDSQNSSQQEQRSLTGSNRGKSVAAPSVNDSGIGPGAMASVGNRYGLDIRI